MTDTSLRSSVTPPAPPRPENAIFADLERLCRAPGYVYALAVICVQNDWVAAAGSLTANAFSHLYAGSHLIRPEVSALIYLLARHPIDHTRPSIRVVQEYVQRTHLLLKELHSAIAFESFAPLVARASSGQNLSTDDLISRETLLYSGDTAYHFQYLHLAKERYRNDTIWFKQAHAPSVDEIHRTLASIVRVQQNKARRTLTSQSAQSPALLLDIFTFTVDEVSVDCQMDPSIVRRVTDLFALSPQATRFSVLRIDDFNPISAWPLLLRHEDTFVLFQFYTLMESFYVSPAYWMRDDSAYAGTASANRGKAAELLARDSLTPVFGKTRVYTNVDIYRGRNRLGEVDVLVAYADRLILFQAKAKGLTLAARRGDNREIRSDFQKAIQDSYDQAHRCALAILDPSNRVFTANGDSLNLRWPIKEIYPVCIVADHYPALSWQTRQFLAVHRSKKILAPLTLDIFALDTILEFLATPAEFLNYLCLRARFREKSIANIEHTFLSYHLKRNLWIDQDYDYVMLEDDISQDLDAAMCVRRLGVNGAETPDGILTRMRDTVFGRIVDCLRCHEHPATICLALFLLQCSSDVWRQMDLAIGSLRREVSANAESRSISSVVGESGVGLTVKCVSSHGVPPVESLRDTCTAHKYKRRVGMWVGVIVSASDGIVRDVVCLEYPWRRSPEMEHRLVERREHTSILGVRTASGLRAVGRNAPCPCGSGKKSKKCCMQ